MPRFLRSPRSLRSVFAVLALGAASLGCPPGDSKKESGPQPAKAACAHVGQNCEVARGKLGTCILKDGCTEGADCFVCQSQH